MVAASQKMRKLKPQNWTEIFVVFVEIMHVMDALQIILQDISLEVENKNSKLIYQVEMNNELFLAVQWLLGSL